MTQTPRDHIVRFLEDCGITDLYLANQQAAASVPDVAPTPLTTRSTEPLISAPEPSDSVMTAREVARSAPNLTALHAAIAAFEGCPLKASATQAVFGAGPVGAPVIIVGEAPGRDEDREGVPFVGRSGQLLTKMLAAIGLARTDVYVTNVLPWRPPANRTPTPAEAATCEVFLRREIALVRPRLVVALGRPAMKTLFGIDASIMRERGRWRTYNDPDESFTADGLATFHPAYLLRTPAEKRRAWQDLLAIKAKLADTPGPA